MKVYFEQSGGIAGIDKSITIMSDLLAPKERLELEQLIESTRYFDLPTDSLRTPSRGADYFRYKIIVETDQRQHSITTTDLTMPPTLPPLIRYLRLKVLKHQENQPKLL